MHIYDIRGNDLNVSNKKIAGNLVMAYGRWNVELGKKSYDESKKEKYKIYGKDIMEDVKNILLQCNI